MHVVAVGAVAYGRKQAVGVLWVRDHGSTVAFSQANRTVLPGLAPVKPIDGSMSLTLLVRYMSATIPLVRVDRICNNWREASECPEAPKLV